MAKRDIARGRGKLSPSLKKYRQGMLEETFKEIDKRKRILERLNRGNVLGPREIILEAFKKTHRKEDAYYAMECINEKIGSQAFSRQMIDSWINDYVNKEKINCNRERDDDDDAR